MVKKSIKLANGYDFYEGLSFFQKTIREGKVDQALYWGHYLFLEKSYATSAFRRMRIITHEDIGLANPEAIILIDELHNKWKGAKWEKRDSNLWKVGVTYLCKSNKNKENDWFLIMGTYHMKHGWEPPIECDLYASLMDGREEIAFYHMWQLRNKDDESLWNVLRYNIFDDQFISACYNSYNECKTSKGADGFWSLAILYISRGEYRLLPLYYDNKADANERIKKHIDEVEDIDVSSFKPKIPDYYYDMHTYKGRSKGRGFEHWLRYCKPHPYVEFPDDRYRIRGIMIEILDRESLKKKK